jgi:hypothetical protein
MRHLHLTTTFLVALSIGAPRAADAQILRGGHPDSAAIDGGAPHYSEFGRRSSGSISFTQTRPRGDLARNIDFGYGGSGNYVFRLDKAGIVGLRLGGSMAAYGRERFSVPLSYAVGGRVRVDVTTTNTIGTLTIGPELMFPEGFIRPYAHAGMGLIWMATTSSVQGVDSYSDEFQTRNYSDGTPTWTAGGGVHIPLSRRRTAVLLDLGLDYFYGGDASYLRKGSIVDLPNGEIAFTPLFSETRFVNVSVGLRITP